MSNTNPDENLDDQEVDEEEETEEETEESEESEEEAPPAKSKVDKRISDLQSALDKEKARANKLEKLAGKRGQESEPGGSDPERAALMAELREASLDAVYGEFAELKDFDIDRGLIEGSNRAEMRESATALVALIKSVSTKARNKVLRDNGLTAEPAGGRREPPKRYDQMSGEDFEKELARIRSGGEAIW